MSRFFDRQLGRNVFAVYVTTLLGYAAPILVIPILAARLDPVSFGEYLYVQAVAVFLSILVEYGFSMSATRRIAMHRESAVLISATVAEVVSARFVLAIAALALLFALQGLIPVLKSSALLTSLCYLIGIAQGFTASWYFQAIERAHVLTRIDAICKVLMIAGIFVFIPEGGGSAGPLAILAAGLVASAVAGNIMIHLEVPVGGLSFSRARAALVYGGRLFFYRGFIALYNSANTFFLGFIVTPDKLAIYAVGEKIVKAAAMLLTPFQQASFARSSRLLGTDARNYWGVLRTLLSTFGILGLGIAAALWLTADFSMSLFLGRHDDSARTVLGILALTVPLIALSGIICNNYLIPSHQENVVIAIVIAAAALNVAVLFLAFRSYGVLGAAAAWTTVEMFVLVALAIVVMRKALNPVVPAEARR